ncbi:hypothetical protein B0H16DRAFT_1860400 [Mycena metata]|uniref:Uncharacterized protein n=1 Tax=Mycena metata TaxID=1033252 RepID=A0AAD7GI05_9AGAR|nr:hypothetical protein B0H16DRAFT_1860400 [Mycena metata]
MPAKTRPSTAVATTAPGARRSSRNTPTTNAARLPATSTPARDSVDATPENAMQSPSPAPAASLHQDTTAPAIAGTPSEVEAPEAPMPEDEPTRVRSPTPSGQTSIPFSTIVAESATFFNAPAAPQAAEASGAALFDPAEYPPLLPAGDEVMNDTADSQEEKAPVEPKPASPFLAPEAPRRPSLTSSFGAHDATPDAGILSPIEDNTGVMGAAAIPPHSRDDEQLTADINIALARSLLPVYDTPEKTTTGASTSKRKVNGPESPPKRTHTESRGESSARVTREDAREAAGGHARDPPARRDQSLEDVVPRYLTEDGRPPRLPTTLPPPGGWPLITGIDREALLRGVDPQQRAAWEEEEDEGPTSLAFRFGGSQDPTEEARQIRSTVAGVLNVSATSFRVGAGFPAADGPPLNTFIIAGLTDFQNQCLQNHHVISGPDISFCALPTHPQNPGYLGTIVDLDFDNTEQGAIEARNAIRRSIMTNTRLVQLFQIHRDAVPINYSAQDIADELHDSISLLPIELTGARGARVAWRVYSVISTNNPDHVRLQRLAFRETRVVTSYSFRGVVRADMSCGVCRSIDHPSPLCPFPRIHGWMGPSAETMAATAQAARAAAAAARGRGRGRGRGNRGGNQRGNQRGRGF